jgi:hypothetical protein
MAYSYFFGSAPAGKTRSKFTSRTENNEAAGNKSKISPAAD